MDARSLPPNVQDYVATKAKFCYLLPDTYNFCRDVIDKWAKDEGKTALIAVDANGENPKHVTFFDLKRAANRFANACLGLGFQRGDRVLVMLPRVPEWYVAILGLIRIGVVPCPATSLLTPKDIAYRAQTAGMKAAVMDLGSAEKLEAVLRASTLLRSLELKKGDTLAMFLPNLPEVLGTRQELIPFATMGGRRVPFYIGDFRKVALLADRKQLLVDRIGCHGVFRASFPFGGIPNDE